MRQPSTGRKLNTVENKDLNNSEQKVGRERWATRGVVEELNDVEQLMKNWNM